ncbi:Hypothetical protein SRAE_2000320800 [Strongyloides ratti]|uniref:Uncharacterized protein n=1 Tax=Strongyloides ratti TaxID=34506 RepID=A0A090LFL0_STRRB|nr:Hypothetical protein SRAE_2000320800 [Strongyloides ratti]CEF68552.1 Hypothetical protein SRAE_2000320800 [Strongyloides ratti]
MSNAEESQPSTVPQISDSEHADNLNKLAQMKDGAVAETADLLMNIETIITMASKKQMELAQAFEDKIESMSKKMESIEKAMQCLMDKVSDDKM